MISLFSA